jgi:hypothetical protein
MKSIVMPQGGDRFFLNCRRAQNEPRAVAGSWLDFACSYKVCADRLIEAQKTRPVVDRSEVYPTVFLYRHYMELELKSVVAIGRVAERGENATAKVLPILNTHALKELLQQCREICEWLGLLNGQFADAFTNFSTLIDEFSEHDPNSFSFRYPIDKKLNPTLTRLGDIDLNHVEVMMKRSAAFLRTMREAVEHELAALVDYNDMSAEEEAMYTKGLSRH